MMSTDNALAFMAKVSQDDELYAKIQNTAKDTWPKLAGEVGFECTAAELKEVSKLIRKKVGQVELSQKDLDKVAGGYAIAGLGSVNLQGLRFNVRRLNALNSYLT